MVIPPLTAMRATRRWNSLAAITFLGNRHVETTVKRGYEDYAEELGLKLVDPADFTLIRTPFKKGFRYKRIDGKPLAPKDEARIVALVIPPAWTDVRCCGSAKGHIQAVGQDVLGRRQYIYHPKWENVRNSMKTNRLLAFGKALPRIRKRVMRDMRSKPTSGKPLAALAIKLIDQKAFRAGHEKYAKDGGRGIASLKSTDLKIDGNTAGFVFAGKSKKTNEITIKDPSAVKRLRLLKRRGRLFQYKDENRWRKLHAGKLNEYLREISGSKVSAKDFRTFHGSARALAFLAGIEAQSESARKRAVAAAMRHVSEFLRNTPAVTRSSYVHPLIIESFNAGELGGALLRSPHRKGLSGPETGLMRLLEGER
ncbi:DNA topoisomerase IB [Phyllobacterium pellucidum]|uniref:DNA topoisomerase IB n=1 Tax=Phyllobacterium pellucidum TaxID=2740464 RepID=UPI001D13C934|nr:DNA topoisomerase IB [Phyllobacterium sp. T1018]UGY09799.1 DNA topoisomerase IB [Phyllobacterium sp. T1018]